MTRPIRIVASFLTVGSWTLLSKLAGFMRDILIANFFGSSATAEAFQVAFALPNTFRRFFAEGAFNMAFVPMFSKKLEGGDDHVEFATDAFSVLSTMLILLTLIAQLAMPWLVWAMASGFSQDGRFDLAVDMGRIVFPYIFFISLAAMLSGVLNSMGRFAAAAAAPVLLNIILVGAMTLAWLLGTPIEQALVWGVPLAGIAQMALVWWAADRAGLRLLPRLPKFTPDLKRLFIIAAPAALAGGVVQINLLVGRQVASYFEGAIQWLAVADRLYQLPLGVVGIAIGVVLLPDLSRRLRSNDTIGGKAAVNRAAEFSLFLTLPAAFALMVIPLPLISVMFQRGQFTAADSTATALLLAIYGAGLPAFVLQKVLQPLFFAREDTKTPFYYALVSMVINAVVAIGLSFSLGYIAAALGTTIASWAMVLLLWNGSRSMGEAARIDSRLRRALPRILAASLAMALVVYLGSLALQSALTTDGVRYLALAGLIVLGCASYAAFAFAFGATSRNDLRSALRR